MCLFILIIKSYFIQNFIQSFRYSKIVRYISCVSEGCCALHRLAILFTDHLVKNHLTSKAFVEWRWWLHHIDTLRMFFVCITILSVMTFVTNISCWNCKRCMSHCLHWFSSIQWNIAINLVSIRQYPFSFTGHSAAFWSSTSAHIDTKA